MFGLRTITAKKSSSDHDPRGRRADDKPLQRRPRIVSYEICVRVGLRNPVAGLPPELECFWLQEPVAERSAEERLQAALRVWMASTCSCDSEPSLCGQERKLKVWEKPTCSSSYGAISKIRDPDLPMASSPYCRERLHPCEF